MIDSFACRETEALFRGRKSKKLPPTIQQTARRKSVYLNEVTELIDLRSPPGNRLEALKGERKGQFSIRINQQWRICFEWDSGKAKNVEIVDYHLYEKAVERDAP